MDDIQSFFSQKVGCLLCAVAAQDDQAVQTQLVIGLLHGLNFVKTFFIRNTHELEGLPGSTQDRAALCQDTGKIS